MADTLLLTKLKVPQIRGNLVTRMRLLEMLDADLYDGKAFNRRLTLVSAPAGYGKTTLLAEWLQGKGGAAWYAIDPSDNDPARFLAYLVASMQLACPGFGENTHRLLNTPQPPPAEAVLAVLLNDLGATGAPLILALDDYHLIHTPAIHQMLAYLLERLPTNVHLAVLTREDPLLPVPRLRARGELLELRQADLQFTPTETTNFLTRVMGLSLRDEEIDALESHTEGWIAGLHLAAISLRGLKEPAEFIQQFTGSNRFILDYLIDEVLAHQPLEIQEFLLMTSILARFSGPLCDEVTGRSGSQQILEILEQSNLFIHPLDQSRTWYRYHRLFAELLLHRLRLSEKLGRLELHRRASHWHEGQGYSSEAIEHAIAAQDWAAAARLIGENSSAMLKRGEFATLLRWFGLLPSSLVNAQAELCAAFAWALMLAARLEPAGELLDQAERLAPPGSALLGQVAAAQAFLERARGNQPRAVQKSRLALELLEPTDFATRGNLQMNLGLIYWHAGQLDEAEQALKEAQELSQHSNNLYGLLTSQIFLARTLAARGLLRQAALLYDPILQHGGRATIVALAHYDLAVLNYEWNELKTAREHLDQGLEIARSSGNQEFISAGILQLALICLGNQDIPAAVAAIQQYHSLTENLSPVTRARGAACHVQIALAMKDLEKAKKYAAQVAGPGEAHSFYRFACFTPARLLLGCDQKSAAASEARQACEVASRMGWGYARIAGLVIQSLAEPAPEEGLQHLSEALALAEPHGYLRTFIDAGPALVPLLNEAARRGVFPAYVRQILSAMGANQPPIPAVQELGERLSQRELEVLHLVAAGLSNRKIAARLVISLGTAKTHIHHIFGKLGVFNRAEAVARAIELKLV